MTNPAKFAVVKGRDPFDIVYYLEVVKETKSSFITREAMAPNIRDFGQFYRGRGIVRWSKSTSTRAGETANPAPFRITLITTSLTDAGSAVIIRK